MASSAAQEPLQVVNHRICLPQIDVAVVVAEDAEDDSTNANKKRRVDEPVVRELNGEKISKRQPKLVTGGVMRDYQLDGIEWMRSLFENGINGGLIVFILSCKIS